METLEKQQRQLLRPTHWWSWKFQRKTPSQWTKHHLLQVSLLDQRSQRLPSPVLFSESSGYCPPVKMIKITTDKRENGLNNCVRVSLLCQTFFFSCLRLTKFNIFRTEAMWNNRDKNGTFNIVNQLPTSFCRLASPGCVIKAMLLLTIAISSQKTESGSSSSEGSSITSISSSLSIVTNLLCSIRAASISIPLVLSESGGLKKY